MKELLTRLQAETPVWFKNIIRLALTLAGAGVSIRTAQEAGYPVPAYLLQISNYCILAGMVATAIAKTAKVDAPAGTEVTQPNGSAKGPSTPLVLLLIALAACLLTGCASRKVAINKTTDVFTKTASSKLVDSTKSSYSNSITLQQYFGDTLTGSLFFATNTPHTDSAETVAPFAGAAAEVDSLESGGIKIKVGLLPVAGGFKARIIAVSKPVETQSTQVNTGQTALAITQTADSTSTGKHTGNVKTIATSGRALPGLLIVILLFLLAAGIYFLYKTKFAK